MQEEEKKTVDIDTSGPDVSKSTIGSLDIFSSFSGIVFLLVYVKIRGIYLQGFPRSLKLHHHLEVLSHPHLF